MADSLARSLIRLIVTVGILAAVYFFIVKPVLDTTNSTIDRAFNSTDSISNQIQDSIDSAGITDFKFKSGSSSAAQQRVLKCVQRANQDVEKIQACVN